MAETVTEDQKPPARKSWSGENDSVKARIQHLAPGERLGVTKYELAGQAQTFRAQVTVLEGKLMEQGEKLQMLQLEVSREIQGRQASQANLRTEIMCECTRQAGNVNELRDLVG